MDVFSKVNKWLVWGMGIVFAMGFQSCLDDDNDNWYGKVIPNALVTVKNVDDGSFFLQLDDSTTLLPINVASSPFGEKEVRALVNYDEGVVRAMTEREDLKYITDIAAGSQAELDEKFGKRVFATAKKMGAETAEANVNAGLAAANQIVDFLKNGNTRFQVNK